MARRLTRIYTRTGDDGSTGLANGSRVPKDDVRLEAIGAVDELNSAVGLVLAEPIPPSLRATLAPIQHDLLDIGGELSLPGHTLLDQGHVERLERELERLNSILPALQDFVLPGGTRAAAAAHLARTICRRAERRLVALGRRDTLAPILLHYLNRLSDLLFVAARSLNQEAGEGEAIWEQGKHRRGRPEKPPGQR
jgi:cob(I)alamin adenosyltransferase